MLKIGLGQFRQRFFEKRDLIAVFSVALLLRFYRLGAHDLWYDEVFSVLYAKFQGTSWMPPLYWDVLHFWIKIAGVSEIALRFLPAIFSFFTTIVVFLFGKKLFGRRTALFSTWLIALSPFHLWYAQEGRDYAMTVFLGTTASYVFSIALREKGAKNWLIFLLLSLAGIYTSYFYHFLLLAQFLYALYFFRLRLRSVFLPFLLIAAIFALHPPTIFQAKFMLFLKRGALWIPRPDWQSMPIVLQNFVLGYSGTAFLYTLSSCVALACFVHLFIIARNQKNVRPEILFCVFLFIVPIVLIFLFSKLFFSVFLTRGLLLFSPYFYFLVAHGVMEWPKVVRIAFVALLIGIMSCGVYLYFKDHIYPPVEYHIGTYIKNPIRPMVDYLKRHVGKGDLLALTCESVMPGVVFYSQEALEPYYLRTPEMPDVGMRKIMLRSNCYIPAHSITNYSFEKLWVVFTNFWRAKFDRNSILVEKWLNSHLALKSRQEIDGLLICSYEKRKSS